MGGDGKGNSQQISIPKPARGDPEGWRDEVSREEKGREERKDVGGYYDHCHRQV